MLVNKGAIIGSTVHVVPVEGGYWGVVDPRRHLSTLKAAAVEHAKSVAAANQPSQVVLLDEFGRLIPIAHYQLPQYPAPQFGGFQTTWGICFSLKGRLNTRGEQSLAIGFGHSELFRSIGALSPSMPRELADRWASALADSKAANAKWKVLWIACGRQDPGHLSASRKQHETLQQAGIRHLRRNRGRAQLRALAAAYGGTHSAVSVGLGSPAGQTPIDRA